MAVLTPWQRPIHADVVKRGASSYLMNVRYAIACPLSSSRLGDTVSGGDRVAPERPGFPPAFPAFTTGVVKGGDIMATWDEFDIAEREPGHYYVLRPEGGDVPAHVIGEAVSWSGIEAWREPFTVVCSQREIEAEYPDALMAWDLRDTSARERYWHEAGARHDADSLAAGGGMVYLDLWLEAEWHQIAEEMESERKTFVQQLVEAEETGLTRPRRPMTHEEAALLMATKGMVVSKLRSALSDDDERAWTALRAALTFVLDMG
jgi:hypothetical protein